MGVILMLEYAPVLVAVAAIIPKLRGKKNERAKIEEVFENLRFAVGTGANIKLPEFKKKFDTEDARRYEYWLPSGLVIPDKLAHILSQTLNKPVEVSGENVMSIWVYKSKLPTKWDYKDVPDKEGWIVPIGKSFKELVWHDFDKIPHMTVAGATTWGKTVFLKMIATYLMEHHPDDVKIYVLDLKGGLAFHRYAKLKQMVMVAEDIETSLKALKAVKKASEKDRAYFKTIYAENVLEAESPKRTFIFIDEAGELVPNSSMSDEERKNAKECQQLLSYIARVSGQLGYKMIFSTQYPTADIMDRQIKANSSAKVSFRLETSTQSGVALDMHGAEKLEQPGRAIYKTAEVFKVQTPYINNKEMWERLRRYEVEKPYIEDAEGGGDIDDIGSIRIYDEETTTDNE